LTTNPLNFFKVRQSDNRRNGLFMANREREADRSRQGWSLQGVPYVSVAREMADFPGRRAWWWKAAIRRSLRARTRKVGFQAPRGSVGWGRSVSSVERHSKAFTAPFNRSLLDLPIQEPWREVDHMGSSLGTVEEAAGCRDVRAPFPLDGSIVIIVLNEARSSGAAATYSQDGATGQ
jgi:hypothetical protein